MDRNCVRNPNRLRWPALPSSQPIGTCRDADPAPARIRNTGPPQPGAARHVDNLHGCGGDGDRHRRRGVAVGRAAGRRCRRQNVRRQGRHRRHPATAALPDRDAPGALAGRRRHPGARRGEGRGQAPRGRIRRPRDVLEGQPAVRSGTRAARRTARSRRRIHRGCRQSGRSARRENRHDGAAGRAACSARRLRGASRRRGRHGQGFDGIRRRVGRGLRVDRQDDESVAMGLVESRCGRPGRLGHPDTPRRLGGRGW